MNNREVMQQALDAMQSVDHATWAWACVEAIASLRAALAEQEQEPVAKVDLMTTGGNAGLATRIVEIYDHLRDRLRPGQLLYAAPPQRQPLTDDEIHDCFQQRHKDKATKRRMITRAIERAHGIE